MKKFSRNQKSKTRTYRNASRQDMHWTIALCHLRQELRFPSSLSSPGPEPTCVLWKMRDLWDLKKGKKCNRCRKRWDAATCPSNLRKQIQGRSNRWNPEQRTSIWSQILKLILKSFTMLIPSQAFIAVRLDTTGKFDRNLNVWKDGKWIINLILVVMAMINKFGEKKWVTVYIY